MRKVYIKIISTQLFVKYNRKSTFGQGTELLHYIRLWFLTINGRWCDFVPVGFCKVLKAPANRMVKKLLNKILRQFYIALHAFSQNTDLMSPKSRKLDQKMKKNERSIAVFPDSPRGGHFIPLVSRLGRRGLSMFGNMLKCCQRHEACKFLAKSPEQVWRTFSKLIN